MKKIFLGLSLSLMGVSSFGQKTDLVEITGKVQNVAPDKKVYLQVINGRGTPITLDSSVVKADKSFAFKHKVSEESGYYLLNFFNLELSQKVLLILEGGEKVQVLADGMNLPQKQGKFTITGNSKNIEYFNMIVKYNQDLQAKIEVWNKQATLAKDKKDEATLQKVQNEFQAAQAMTVGKIKALLPDMGSNLVALWTAGNFLNPDNDLEQLKAVAETFKKEKPNSKNIHVKSFLEQIKRLDGVNIGAEAPEIAFKNPKDSLITLSSYKGKYVLIDFWASWCGPCRRENPNVVKIYEKYKNKGFDILGVSLDQDKNSWIKAIEKDGLVWNQVSDLQYWNSAAAAAYGVTGIPAQFLVDKEGKIVAKFVGGSLELEQKLEELFKQ